MRFLKPRNLPTRLATGAYILHAGLEKWSGDEARAVAVHGMAAGAFPMFKDMPPTRFLRLLAASEVAIGTALLLPFVSNRRGRGGPHRLLRGPRLHVPANRSAPQTGELLAYSRRHRRQQRHLDARDRPRPACRPLGSPTCARDAAPVGP